MTQQIDIHSQPYPEEIPDSSMEQFSGLTVPGTVSLTKITTESAADVINDPVLPAAIDDPTGSSLLRATQVALTVAEVTPLNEVVRGGLLAASEAFVSHGPVIGAVALGASTLAVEGVGVLAAAPLMATDRSQRIFKYINEKLRKVGYGENRKLSPAAKAAATYLGGSVVAMAIEQREDPTRTVEQNRRFGLKNAAVLSGVLSVQGALIGEGIDIGIDHPLGAAVAGTTVTAFETTRRLSKRARRHERLAADSEVQDMSLKDGIAFGLTTDPEKLRQVAELEQDVWNEKGYGSLDEYSDYITHSRTFAAFNEKQECVGLTRMFGGTEELPPFMEMEFDDPEVKETIADKARAGLVEELGTLAKRSDMPIKAVSTRLWRLAYRDARERGIESWGIIMEPERVEKMNERYHFTFKQLGPTEYYQGGDCAPFIMNLQEVDDAMSSKARFMYHWFVKKALKV